MGRLTNIDSPIVELLNKILNLVILNICFIIGALPVITIGASISALNSVTLKMVDNKESYVFRSFWKAYKVNFRISEICWVLSLVAGTMFFFNFVILFRLNTNRGQVLLGIMVVMFLLFFGTVIYTFFYIAQFEDKTSVSIKNAFMIFLSNHVYSLVIIAITVTPVLLTIYSLSVFLRMIFIWAVIGFALLSFVQAFFIHKIFAKYYN